MAPRVPRGVLQQDEQAGRLAGAGSSAREDVRRGAERDRSFGAVRIDTEPDRIPRRRLSRAGLRPADPRSSGSPRTIVTDTRLTSTRSGTTSTDLASSTVASPTARLRDVLVGPAVAVRREA